jgi:radical SAM protein with 4Fe4S-binding SPASM domain
MRAILDHIQLRPKFCVWEITARCNMRCLHCASDLDGPRARRDELSLSEALDLCDQLADLGCEKVVLSGGEAFLRSDWEQIARRLVSLGIHVAAISNGLVIDERLARRIKAVGLCRVALSLDGLEATHNYIRQNDASFARVLHAARLLKSQGLPLNIVTHVNRRNLGALSALEDLVVGLAADVWRLQLGSPLGRLARHPELLVDPADLPEIADFVVAAKQRRRVAVSVGNSIGYFSHHERALRSTPNRGDLDFWCGCSAGCLNVGIEANGNVKGCLSLQSDQFLEGNIRESPLRDIWERAGAFRYTRGFEPGHLRGHCQDCELGEICRGGCAFMAFGATGRVHDNPYCLYGLAKRSSSAKVAHSE